jgi:GNAT superfamily N-acetyltransferase
MSLTGERFVRATIEAMGFDAGLADVAGVSIAPTDDRAGSAMAAAYAVGRHIVLWCDPTIVARLEPLVASLEPNLDDWARSAEAAGAELVGSAEMTTLADAGFRPVTVPSGFRVVDLDRDRSDHVELIATFVDAIGPVDADDAEIELDDLDPVIRVLVDAAGQVVAFAGASPWSPAPGFFDIGVAVRADGRGLGLGRAVVTELCHLLLADGGDPLYRFNVDNEGSRRLSAGLGFERALQLTAYKFA